VLSLQSEVARAIANQIKIAITPMEEARLTSARTVNPEAYEAYLKGRHHWNKRTPDGLNKSLAYFEQAIELDSSCALGYSGLADAFNMIGSYSYYPPSDMLPKAKEAALQALAIDSTRAEAHISLAAVQLNYDWDWQAAEEGFRRAIELNPGYALAYRWYSQYLIAMGRIEESWDAINRALELDPLNLEINGEAARKFYFTRQYDQAIEQCLKTLEIDDRFFLTQSYLGLSYAHKGMYEEAIPPLQAAVALSSENPLVKCGLGYVYGIAGREKEAQDVLEELFVTAKTRYVPAISIAAVYMGLGDKDRVFEWLEKAYQERHHYLVFFQVEPMVDNLRSDPRFMALLEKMGLD
jgi:tetratricopeptide (TPR) repeat protein